MRISLRHLLAAAMLAVFVLATATPLSAQVKATEIQPRGVKPDDKKQGDKKTELRKSSLGMSIVGTVSGTDKNAMTVSIHGGATDRVLSVTSQSRITKDGKPATLDDIHTGDRVLGAYRKGEGDKLEIVNLTVNATPAGNGGKKSDENK